MHVSEQTVIDILRTLVGFNTISSESNLPLIEWVEEYLDQREVPHWRVNESNTKCSLLARIGPEAPGGIVLSGHTDVVPVKAQPWATDPFVLTEKDGLLHGRGTSDMKSFLALALAHVSVFQKKCLTRPVWFAFSHDEEIGCLGASAMAEALIAHQARPALVVVGEPTMMRLVDAHKGIHSFETVVTGREAHSSMPEQGVNAVMVMAELMSELNRIAAEARTVRDDNFASVTPYTSVHIGVVEGGVQRNIIPRHCRMLWEVRPIPATDVAGMLAPFHARAAALEADMQKVDSACGIVTRPITNVRGLQRMSDGRHVPLACKLAAANHAEAVAYGTEGGIFQAHGLPVIVCGPGSIDQAHQPNEYVSHEQLILGAAFMQRVAEACIGV